MQSILETCQPREDLLKGAFNPEIFTASLQQVMNHYREDARSVHTVYTDAEAFFKEATYPTEGMKMALGDIFARLMGDESAPAIHRLETAFGGGKTHTLIAAVHLAKQGKAIADASRDLIDSDILPEKDVVKVVGVAGDKIPVHKPQGVDLVPYTLWGEIAYQIGGKELYKAVEQEAASYAAPGENYFQKVFGDSKVLIMLDELAQYAARLEAARSNGSEQLAAFLMGLHDHARSYPGISVVLTLAGEMDAFARQTRQLQELIAHVRGEEITEDDAIEIAQSADGGVRSVVARDAVTVVPVQASEIRRVLAKRLFSSVDHAAAGEICEAYGEMYQRNSSMLPDEATRDDYFDELRSHYPFHPTFIRFLNQKLATVENFQGTRGVLRVLSLAVHSLWEKKAEVPMIHTCHLDLRASRVINEIVGRTGANDLLPVLNSDVGGADTGQHIEGGRSNAELADRANPHPEGFPLYEYVWKTVFLHSLVGRDEGLASNRFGITEQDALLEVSFPGLTPPQVRTALQQIEETAFYLRKNEGRYFASTDPSVNVALAKIRRQLSNEDIQTLLATTARKVVSGNQPDFRVSHDVERPGDIPDKTDKPVLALLLLNSEPVSVEELITKSGPDQPRFTQNMVFLLVPQTVKVTDAASVEEDLFNNQQTEVRKARQRVEELARWVLAMHKLKEAPDNYGIRRARLAEQNFDQRLRERDQALVTTVTQAYNSLWFPSASGKIVRKELKTAGGEGGASVIEEIRRVLTSEGELLTRTKATTLEALQNLNQLFFDGGQVVDLKTIQENFRCRRSWPVLENSSLLGQIVREGVERGVWCLFRMKDEESTAPDTFYSRESDSVPLDVDIQNDGWSLVTPPGAKQRGWTGPVSIPQASLQNWIRDALAANPATQISEIQHEIEEKHGAVPQEDLLQAVNSVIRHSRAFCYNGKIEQEEKPEELIGENKDTLFHNHQDEEIIIAPAEAAKRGWIQKPKRAFSLEGTENAAKFIDLLRQVGNLYSRGASTTIDDLDLMEIQLPGNATMRLALSNATPETLKRLDEFFECLVEVAEPGPQSDMALNINDPQEDCPFFQELKKLVNNSE